MSITTIGIIGIIAFLVLMFLKVPVGFAMALIGFLGIAAIRGLEPGLATIVLVPFRETATYILSSLPLFILMGFLAADTGLSRDFFHAVNKWLGHIRGGMAISTVGACTAFGAVCGDMISAAVTMCFVALPEMRRYKYDDKLTLGCIAAGGNLSTLIPPSISFIVYGVLTEVSIGALFIAGILPGLLLALFFVFTIIILCRINPELASAGTRAGFTERIKSLGLVWPFVVLIILVLGGIYAGVFTPTESGAIGVFGVAVLALIKRKLSWDGIANSLSMTAKLTGMIFVLLIGAMIFSRFMAVTEMSLALTNFIAHMSLAPYLVLGAILVFYIVVGFFVNVMGIIVLTIPVLHPILVGLGFNPLWIAVLVMITASMGHISPPFGLVVFALSGAVKDVPLFTIFRGALPFVGAMGASLIVVAAFPVIATILPSLMR